ncbi:MAG: biotin-dependent carboxyltransferase family protein [Hyphomicrobiaceae bacterium]
MTTGGKKERTLLVERAGPYTSIQDAGRPGYLSSGITEGGAADQTAYREGLVLIGARDPLACLEIFGMGGAYLIQGGDICACLSGAPIPITLDGQEVPHRTSFVMRDGQRLELGVIRGGNISYLTVGGGFDVPEVFGSRSTHLRAGIGGLDGRVLRDGDVLPVGPAEIAETGLQLPDDEKTSDDTIRVMLSGQSHLFDDSERARFLATPFKITHELDRMGARLEFNGDPFSPKPGPAIVSESIVQGDIQIMGNGQPVVLLADRQPTGGYPRIACVISADIAKFVQMQPGSVVRFELVEHGDAVAALRVQHETLASLPDRLMRRVRSNDELANMLSTNLISGAVADGDGLPWD